MEKTSAELLNEQLQAEEEALAERVKEHQQDALMKSATPPPNEEKKSSSKLDKLSGKDVVPKMEELGLW